MSGSFSLIPPYVFMAYMGIALAFYFYRDKPTCIEVSVLKLKKHRTCILPSPNYVMWQVGLRLVEARIRIVLVSQNLMKTETKGLTT